MNDMPTKLPANIGGYQHLAPDTVPKPSDIIVLDGHPMVFVAQCLPFATVAQIEAHYCGRVYRKIPVAKQGDNDNRKPSEAATRKGQPVATGVVDYFPQALLAVAELSRIGNDQHNPGKPLHWDRSKSGDEGDALMRHFIERGTFDTDGVRHSAKVAWRALALLQKEIEASRANAR